MLLFKRKVTTDELAQSIVTHHVEEFNKGMDFLTERLEIQSREAQILLETEYSIYVSKLFQDEIFDFRMERKFQEDLVDREIKYFVEAVGKPVEDIYKDQHGLVAERYSGYTDSYNNYAGDGYRIQGVITLFGEILEANGFEVDELLKIVLFDRYADFIYVPIKNCLSETEDRKILIQN